MFSFPSLFQSFVVEGAIEKLDIIEPTLNWIHGIYLSLLYQSGIEKRY